MRCRADQVSVTAEECAGRGVRLSAAAVGKGEDEVEGLRVGELGGAWNPERCVWTPFPPPSQTALPT